VLTDLHSSLAESWQRH